MSDLPRPATPRGEATRQKLLDAAGTEFGERGFAAASVASITRRAGVGQGTFYLYFPSKEDTLRELVRHMGAELRRALAAATRGVRPRLAAERAGFEAFLRFSREHANLYRVVMESQFVDEAVYRDYYRQLAEGYAEGLAAAQSAGEIRRGDPEVQAWALMGIAHFLGLRHVIWGDGDDADEARALDDVFALLRSGLASDGTTNGTTDGGPRP